jgi:hypothetical protein
MIIGPAWPIIMLSGQMNCQMVDDLMTQSNLDGAVQRVFCLLSLNRPQKLGVKRVRRGLVVTSHKKYLIIIVLEALVIAMGAGLVSVRINREPAVSNYDQYNPLLLALKYESPLHKFEQLVKENSFWVNYKSDVRAPDGMPASSILSSCATLGLTNHVRVLLGHGADPEEAITWCSDYGSEEAGALIRAIEESIVVDSQHNNKEL